MFKSGIDCEAGAVNWEKEEMLMNTEFERRLKTQALKVFKGYCKRMGWNYKIMRDSMEVTNRMEFILHKNREYQHDFYYYDTASRTKYGAVAIGIEKFITHVERSFIS